MENNKIKELIKTLRNIAMKCEEEEILNMINIFSNLIKNENKNIRMEFINNMSDIYASYRGKLISKDDEEYNNAVIEQEKLLKQYIPEDKQIDFDDVYCLPLIFENDRAYKKGVIDGLTKLSFLKELL